MKEATGELNMTVITVVAIGAVAAFFYAFIWPSIKTTIQANSVCANGHNYKVGDSNSTDYIDCGSLDKNGQYVCKYATEENGKTVKKQVTCKTK